MGLMFCRFCGAHILEDSLFCAKCGKRLGRSGNPRIEKAVKVFRLNTPYPYFGLLLVLVASWILFHPKSRFDYSQTKWSIEMDRKLDVPDDNLFRESLSLVVENTGSKSIRGIPIEVHARIEPQKLADVVAAFPGDREMVIQRGKPQPVGVVLSDAIAGGAKRRYSFDESVQAIAPFKVTIEVLQDDARTVLANYVLER
jgi:zinc-ribbon domain